LEIIRYAHPFGAALWAFRARKLACAVSLSHRIPSGFVMGTLPSRVKASSP